MVKKSDWQTLDMPVENETFVYERPLSTENMERIKEGYRPQQMEDKWFMYYEDGKLYIHRSWRGICIYIVEISENKCVKAIVNRNPEQYRGTSIERDEMILEELLNGLIYRRI